MASLSGVLPALVTPLDTGGRLDRAGLDRLLDHVLAAPVTGIAPAGSTGEGPLLGLATRVELTRAVRDRLGDGPWVVAGVPARNAPEALTEIDALAKAGASAVLLPPPWYYPVGTAEVVSYFGAIAGSSALPIVAYHIPRLTKVALSPEAMAELAPHPGIVGIKDSGGDPAHLAAVVEACAGYDLAVMTGTDSAMLAALAAGAAGLIGASVNVVPGLVTRLYAAARAGDEEQSARLQLQVAAVVDACGALGFPQAWKAALFVLGVCSARPAHPLVAPDADALAGLDSELRRLGLTRRREGLRGPDSGGGVPGDPSRQRRR